MEDVPETAANFPEFTIKHLAHIDLGDNQFIDISETSDGDASIAWVTNSLDLSTDIAGKSAIELYETYLGESAPEDILRVYEQIQLSRAFGEASEFNSEKQEQLPDIHGAIGQSQLADIWYSLYPGSLITRNAGDCYSSSSSFKYKTKKPYYFGGIATPISGSLTYTIYRRVIRTIGSNYWKTMVGPYNLAENQWAAGYVAPSKYREVLSKVTNSSGGHRHLAGGN